MLFSQILFKICENFQKNYINFSIFYCCVIFAELPSLPTKILAKPECNGVRAYFHVRLYRLKNDAIFQSS